MEFKNSVAVVTGGSSGLGEAIVVRIVENGGRAAIFDLSEEKGNALVEKLGAEYVVFLKTNVTSEEEVKDAIEHSN